MGKITENAIAKLKSVLDEYYDREELGGINSVEPTPESILEAHLAYTDFEDDEVPEEFQDGSNFHIVQVSLEYKNGTPAIVKMIDNRVAFRKEFASIDEEADYLDGVCFNDLVYIG